MPNRPTPRNMRLIGEGRQTTEQRRAETPPKPPAAPTWLTAEASDHWHAIVKEMVVERTWRASFTSTLATYVELLSLFLADPQGFGSTKLVTLRLLGADLGLTPSAFNRVSRTSQR